MNKEQLMNEVKESLERTNVNMGRKTQRREEFIQSVLGIINKHLGEEKNEAVKPAKPNPKSKVVKDRMMVTKSDKPDKLRAGKHSFSMTESESMRADEELGTAPRME